MEQPGVGDPSRRFGPHFLNGESAYFLGFNRNKKGITLDLQKSHGREVLYRLVGISDVVFDNFRPSVVFRLGVGYDTLREVNPTIISCSLSGFGQEGPYRKRPAFDGIVQALGGAMSVTGEAGRPPVFMGFPAGDLAGGYVAVAGMLTALLARERTGQGQRVDISMLDVQIALQGHLGQLYLVSGEVPGPIGSSHHSNIPVGAYRTQDGAYIQVHCATQRFYEKLAQLLASHVEGLENHPQDPRFATPADRIEQRQELEEILRMAFSTRSAKEWIQLLEQGDIPAAPVQDIGQALVDPQVLLRNMVVEMDHPVAGRYKTAGNPIKMGQEEHFQPPPTLGQDTQEVIGELLGYSRREIQSLKEAGII